jgi:hypothetical protein
MKALVLAMAVFFAHSASAVYQTCEGIGSNVKAEMDVETHGMDMGDGKIEEIEIHAYIDVLDYGAGNFLDESLSQEKRVRSSQAWELDFGQGIKLRSTAESANCNIMYEFEHVGQVGATKLCCTVQ